MSLHICRESNNGMRGGRLWKCSTMNRPMTKMISSMTQIYPMTFRLALWLSTTLEDATVAETQRGVIVLPVNVLATPVHEARDWIDNQDPQIQPSEQPTRNRMFRWSLATRQSRHCSPIYIGLNSRLAKTGLTYKVCFLASAIFMTIQQLPTQEKQTQVPDAAAVVARAASVPDAIVLRRIEKNGHPQKTRQPMNEQNLPQQVSKLIQTILAAALLATSVRAHLESASATNRPKRPTPSLNLRSLLISSLKTLSKDQQHMVTRTGLGQMQLQLVNHPHQQT